MNTPPAQDPDDSLAIVMPIYNEEANVSTVITEWITELRRLNIAFTFLAINDGSKDSSLAKLTELTTTFPELQPLTKSNSGHGRSCRFGYDKACTMDVGWVLQIDSDGQCDPLFFESFWKVRKNADCVFGYRTTRGDGLARLLISRFCQFATFVATGTNLQDANVPYRLIRKKTLYSALQKIPADFDIHNIALTLTLKREKNIRWQHVPIHFRDRQGGINSIDFVKIAKMGMDMLRDLQRIQK
ncbi:MAG: glycosyltransferase family 2 protein [Chthoniobacterales bacterium]